MELRYVSWAVGMMLGLCGPGYAQTFTIHTALIPPYVIQAHDGKGQGVILEIITGALDAAGLSYVILNDEPWRRAQAEAIDESNSLISPFARTPMREPNWSWVAKLLDEKIYLYPAKGSPFLKTPTDLDKVKSLGVLAGGAPESIGNELHLEAAMQPVASEIQNARKLESGRLDAWMSQGMMANWAMHSANIAADTYDPRLFFRDAPLWVATSKTTSAENLTLLKKAFAAFLASPAYAEIIGRY